MQTANDSIGKTISDTAQTSTSKKYAQSTSFTPYRSIRPQLLDEINHIINSGLSENQSRRDDPWPILTVYKTAFQRFIDESTLYGPFLRSVMLHYDGCIDKLWERIREVATVHSDLAAKDEEHLIELRELKRIHTVQIDELQQTIKTMQRAVPKKNLEIMEAARQKEVVQKQLEQRLIEIDELRKTNAMLLRALPQLEEEKTNSDSREAEKNTENSLLQLSLQKAHEDVERLRAQVDDLEAAQGHLISRDVVETHENTIEVLREELRTLQDGHKQLMIRYGSLKIAVDSSFQKYATFRKRAQISDDAKITIQTTAGPETIEDIRNTIPSSRSTIRLNESNSRKGPLHKNINGDNDSNNNNQLTGSRAQLQLNESMSPSEDITKMLSSLADDDFEHYQPREIIENLLNQIGKLKRDAITEKKEREGNQFVNAIGSSTDEDGIVGGEAASERFKSPWDHFDGSGPGQTPGLSSITSNTDPSSTPRSLPPYLRTNARVRKTYLSLTDTLQFIHEIRTAAAAASATTTASKSRRNSSAEPLQTSSTTLRHDDSPASVNKLPFAQFFEGFLQERFKELKLIIEIGYNFCDALHKYESDVDCRMFLLVLNDEVSDEIWQNQTVMIDEIIAEAGKDLNKVRESFGDADQNRKISLDAFTKALRRALPNKPERSFQRLVQALSLEVKGARLINFQVLLKPDGQQRRRGKFLELLLQQHLAECKSYVDHLVDSIREASEVEADSGVSGITLRRLRAAIAASDSHKTRSEVNRIMAYCSKMTIEDMLLTEARRTSLPLDDIIKRFRSRLVKKSLPIASKDSS